MKKILIYISVALLMVNCGGPESNPDNHSLESTDSLVEYQINEERTDAVEFNNDMTFMQEGILDLVDGLFQSDSSNVDLNLENCRFEIKMNISKLTAHQKDTSKLDFVNNMIDLMQFYEKEFSGQFLEIASILKKSELSDNDKDLLTSYDETFAVREKEAFEKVFISQEEYAVNNNISLDFQE